MQKLKMAENAVLRIFDVFKMTADLHEIRRECEFYNNFKCVLCFHSPVSDGKMPPRHLQYGKVSVMGTFYWREHF